jgi:hypothetical protein
LLALAISLIEEAQIYQRMPASDSVSGNLNSGMLSTYSGMLATVPLKLKKWTTSHRNWWTTSTGTGGQLGMEWVDNFERCTQFAVRLAHLVAPNFGIRAGLGMVRAKSRFPDSRFLFFTP